jgi:hypothetical protein
VKVLYKAVSVEENCEMVIGQDYVNEAWKVFAKHI